MANRTYYGEYSLGHWIRLLLSRNIVLPPYQRHFVWTKENVEAMAHSLKEERFVPPITIGAFHSGKDVVNYIIDGQQRLTALLLLYIGKYPLLEKFEGRGINLATDSIVDDEADGEGFDYSKEWTYNEILKGGENGRGDILARCDDEIYEDLALSFTEQELKERFIGFAYIVPESRDPKKQQEFYTREFKELNTLGIELNPLESRRSLYFWDKTLTDFFEPPFAKNVVLRGVNKTSRACCLDFVRYLALMSDYARNETCDNVASGWKKNIEGYYFQYICAVVGAKESQRFISFDDVFPGRRYQERMDVLKKAVSDLSFMREHQSIIELDVEFMGLIYWILIKNRMLKQFELNELKSDIAKKVKQFKKDAVHAKAPGLLKYLRARIQASCDIYQKRVQDV